MGYIQSKNFVEQLINLLLKVYFRAHTRTIIFVVALVVFRKVISVEVMLFKKLKLQNKPLYGISNYLTTPNCTYVYTYIYSTLGIAENFIIDDVHTTV